MRRASLWALGLVVACGGEVDRDREPEAPGDEADSMRDAGASAASGAEGSRPNAMELPPCEEGFVRSDEPSRPCAWLTEDGRCYEAKIDACACVCPEQGNNTTCVSSLPAGPNGAVLVDCL